MQTLNEVSCILDDMQDTLDEMSHVSDMISIMTDPNSTEQEKQIAQLIIKKMIVIIKNTDSSEEEVRHAEYILDEFGSSIEGLGNPTNG